MSYIATDHDQTAIYGTGDTAEAAIADALNGCDQLTDLVAYPATPALIALVEDRGGCISWDMLGDTACTVEEA